MSVVNRNKMNIAVAIPWLLSLATVGAGIWQFSVQQAQGNRQPFLQKQLELCFQATETAGRLATETDPTKWEEARATFWRLYWGSLSIVEDPAVEKAMGDLGKMVPTQPVGSPKLPMNILDGGSYALARAARDLLLKSWNVDLPALQER